MKPKEKQEVNNDNEKDYHLIHVPSNRSTDLMLFL